MFDGVYEKAATPRPRPRPRRRRAGLDTRKLLPLLRAHARGMDVEPLAVAIACAAVGEVEDQAATWVAKQPGDALGQARQHGLLGGEVEENGLDKVARRLDFSSMRK